MQDLNRLAVQVKMWGLELGFQQVGITDTNLHQYSARFNRWLQMRFHGQMHYMENTQRLNPQKLLPGTVRIISVRMDYLPADTSIFKNLFERERGYISRYALGKDYHKLLRKRLQKLGQRINDHMAQENYRAFCDSAPVLEKPLAEKAGLGWIGKHTNLINAKAGSWFFLGELFTNIPLPVDTPSTKSHCGSCTACIDVCPTNAIIAPYQLDARKCISYLTIELKDSIPKEFRKAIGNRIYGCDDCQLICPWNKFAKFSREDAFHPRDDLENGDLLQLFSWDEALFLKKTEGSSIRRIGHTRWLRNIAVALGNAPYSPEILAALEKKRLLTTSMMLQEHIAWAISEQVKKMS